MDLETHVEGLEKVKKEDARKIWEISGGLSIITSEFIFQTLFFIGCVFPFSMVFFLFKGSFKFQGSSSIFQGSFQFQGGFHLFNEGVFTSKEAGTAPLQWHLWHVSPKEGCLICNMALGILLENLCLSRSIFFFTLIIWHLVDLLFLC